MDSLSLVLDMQSAPRVYIHCLLLLGRVSNLPTVWSNVLAGWWIGGAGSVSNLILLSASATALYIGGMFLNDAMDVDFDRQYRPERPIPSGRFDVVHVWVWGGSLLTFGLLLLAFIGWVPLTLGGFTVASILVYDWIHKSTILSPVIMAGCRFFLFLTAASTGDQGVSGLAVWSAVALASYIVGLSYLAKNESQMGLLRYWPCLALFVPMVLAWYVNAGDYRRPSQIMLLASALWIVQTLRLAFGSAPDRMGRAVSKLLAGIVLIDLLALGGGPPHVALALVALFLLSLLSQRFIPAT